MEDDDPEKFVKKGELKQWCKLFAPNLCVFNKEGGLGSFEIVMFLKLSLVSSGQFRYDFI